MQAAQCSGIRHTGIRHDTYVAFAQIDRGTVRKMQRCRRQRLPGCKIDIRHGTPCFKPNAVRLQIGLQWQAAQNFSVGLATHGLTGKREGYGGDLSLRLAF